MFNGRLPSSDSAPNRRIATIVALGGVSVAAVAIWMFTKSRRHRFDATPSTNEHISDIKQKQQQQRQEETAADKVTETTTNNALTTHEDLTEQQDHGESSSSTATETREQRQQAAEKKVNGDDYDDKDTSTAVHNQSLVRTHISERGEEAEEGEQGENSNNFGNKLKTEQQQQQEEQKQQQTKNREEEEEEEEQPGKDQLNTELKKEEEQQQKQPEEQTASAAEEDEEQQQHHDDEDDAMLQHHRNDVATSDGGRRAYAGRASIGSTGTAGGGRQHPVNSICTCTRCIETLNDFHSARGYKNAESPNSTHSEGSADSGRATGHLTSYSPFADAAAELGQQAADSLPIYEFEVPNTLVGLIIGIKGKTIKELCTRADVRMLIRPHHTHGKFDSHQLCSVEGRRENINKCLHMIRLRFPPCRFPDLNLKPVFPPPLAAPTKPTTATSTDSSGTVQGIPTVLTLPVGVPCEVYVSAHVDAGHFFVQLPTHPSFQSLALLDSYMLSVYTQPGGAPDLPKPCNIGVLCAAPAYNGWFRAITLAYDQDQDEMLVRFVDYGGFARLPRADLRQIRTDFVTLPLQGIECYLANVQPADGSHWSDKANELFQQLCVSKIIQAVLVGYCKNDGIPCVELFVMDNANKKTVRVDQILLERGLAKPMDPALMVRTPLM